MYDSSWEPPKRWIEAGQSTRKFGKLVQTDNDDWLSLVTFMRQACMRPSDKLGAFDPVNRAIGLER